MKRILVTGATGFIGHSLVEQLIEMGYEVIPIGRTLKSWASDFIKKNLVKIDLTVDKIPDFGKIDCVCLLGARQPYKENKWNEYYDINSKQIFHFLNRDIDQLIYISTTTVNAINSIPDPQNYYGLSKALGERLLKINKNHFSQVSILRLPSVMGVNHYGGIINDLKKWVENDNDIDLYDGGKKYRNILHVNDAVSAIVKTIKFNNKLSNYEEFEIGSEKSNTLNEITNMLIRFMGKNIKINLLDRPTNSIDVYVDNSKAMSKIGYVPRTIEIGIKQYLKDCDY
jgi:nucleoside-diphosphate-sugar epimerase